MALFLFKYDLSEAVEYIIRYPIFLFSYLRIKCTAILYQIKPPRAYLDCFMVDLKLFNIRQSILVPISIPLPFISSY